MSGSGEKEDDKPRFKIDEDFSLEARRRYQHHETEERLDSFEYEFSTVQSTRTVSTRRPGSSGSTVPPTWDPESEPVDYSSSKNDTVFPPGNDNNRTGFSPRSDNNATISNRSIIFNTNVNLPPPLTAIPGHPDMNNSLCQKYNETVDSVDWDSNHGFDQTPDDCEAELQDIINNIPASDVEAGIEYSTVHHFFQFMTSHAVGRLILAGVSCFASAATWRLLILVATNLPLPPQYKVSLLRSLDWPQRFTMSLLRSTSAVARGILIGRRRTVSLNPIQPMQQADAGLIMRGNGGSPRQVVSPQVRYSSGSDNQPGASGANHRGQDCPRQGPYPRRSLAVVLEEEEKWAERNAAQSPPPVNPKQMQDTENGECSVLRSPSEASPLQVQVSPVESRRYSPRYATSGPGGYDTSTPVRPSQHMYDQGMYPPPYCPPTPWSPPYQPWPQPYQYPYYPTSPVSPSTFSGHSQPTTPGLSASFRPATPQPVRSAQNSGRPNNCLMDTPSNSQTSVSSHSSNEMSFALDATVNLSSARWDLSPVVIEAVSGAGGVDDVSLREYLDRSSANFQDLLRQNPEPKLVDEALEGVTLELQSMRTAVRILAVNNVGLPLPTDDGNAATTLDRLDEVLTDGWHEDTPAVGVMISRVMQADSLLAYQEKNFEKMVLRSRAVYSTKSLKKSSS